MQVNATNLRPASGLLSSTKSLPGSGEVEVTCQGDRSVVTRVRAQSPLRLLAPRGCAGKAAWVFTSTFGGGLLAGDLIDIRVRVGQGATCVLTTQASTKIYRSASGRAASQMANVAIESDALCLVLPDPITCFAAAKFEQRLRFELDKTASLVLVDWLTSGRIARGERWAFDSYQSRIDVSVDGKLIFRDAVRLDQSDGPIAGRQRMGRCDCMGLVVLIGPRTANACRQILEWSASQPVVRGSQVLFSASPICGGVVIRVAGPTSETVARWIRQCLDFVPELMGGDPWVRKW